MKIEEEMEYIIMNRLDKVKNRVFNVKKRRINRELTKKALLAIKEGRVGEVEMRMFNKFFNIMRVVGDKEIELKEHKYIDELTDRINLKHYRTQQKGYGPSLKYIKTPSEKVQLAAVKKEGLAIQYIKNAVARHCRHALPV